MEGIELKTVTLNGFDFEVATAGPDGAPVVLFIHGFPELWYSWRHQISSVAAAGYRAVAPNLRGYGGSYAPMDASSYTCFHIVGDLIALISAVAGENEKVFVVGHDWGALIAWYLCLLRPDRVRAVVNLSVPYNPPSLKRKPVDNYKAAYGDDFYICRFQEPGEIEAEFADVGTERIIKKLLTYRTPGPLIFSKDKAFWGSADSQIDLPSWLSEDDVQYYVTNFEKSGFTGPVNYYRNINRNNELLAPWVGSKIKVPAKFITGDQDLVYHMGGKELIHGGGLKNAVPLLEEPVILQGGGHFIMEEKPEEISKLICDFIKKFQRPKPLVSSILGRCQHSIM